MIRSLTHTAQHCGELVVGSDGGLYEDARRHDGGFLGPNGRSEALHAMELTVNKRPDLADSKVVKDLMQISRDDPDSEVRAQAHSALSVVADKRPDLINSDMVKAVSQTSVSPIANHGDSNGSKVTKGRLNGMQSDEWDNAGRGWAQQTLWIIENKRPDLISHPDVNPARAKANPNSPRPSSFSTAAP